ncbi:Uncharacterised protein [Legionella pneumophila]|nr:hypothetical protein [Legionella pneumophila subsp. pneumophila]CZG10194.1 Uncharacterised protein [Legionella pneumophila]CZG32098.1 Uncharacterised protein [Legionella pneumophila]CZG38061.1 Uncharacterised protein [Legionella pneumophila]CZG45977.1 Uncharacterised protein [Legionella pneumophila]
MGGFSHIFLKLQVKNGEVYAVLSTSPWGWRGFKESGAGCPFYCKRLSEVRSDSGFSESISEFSDKFLRASRQNR